jgi:hypothetical protein
MAPMSMSSSSVSFVRFWMVIIPASLSSFVGKIADIRRFKRSHVGPAHALDLIEHLY